MSHLRHVANIKAIYRYPVKSMAGEQLVSVELGWHGIAGDRRFAFMRAGNISGFPWLTASKMPELIQYKARHINAKDGSLPTVRVQTPDGLDVEVESESLRQQIVSKFGTDVSLIGLSNGIFDDSPISVISTTTIKKLETESGCSLDPRRFRPNLLIDPIDTDSVDESTWVGKTVMLGELAQSPAVRVTIRDVRCVMVNLDPETAVSDPRVLKTIGRSHNNCAGVYASVFKVGTLATGDRVYLNED